MPHSRAHLAETWETAYRAYRALPGRHPLRETLSLDLGVLSLIHARHVGAGGCVDPAEGNPACEPVRAAVELLRDRLALREEHLGADAPAIVDDLLVLADAEETLGDGGEAAALRERAGTLAAAAGRPALLDEAALGFPAARRGAIFDAGGGDRPRPATEIEAEVNAARLAITCVDEDRCRIDASHFEEALGTHERLAARLKVVPQVIDGVRHGFRLYGVRFAGTFSRLGVRNGDVLVEVNGVRVNDAAAYDAAIAAARTSGELTLGFLRKSATRRLTLRIVGDDPT